MPRLPGDGTAGWTRDGRTYYYSAANDRTQWERPTHARGPPLPDAAALPDFPRLGQPARRK